MVSRFVPAATPAPVDLLILGAGWTSHFLLPLLKSLSIHFAATTTTGHDSTISFKFDPDATAVEPYEVLPAAKNILITFPLKGMGQAKTLTGLYGKAHKDITPRWIQLGSTGIFTAPQWNDHNSPYDHENARAIAEDELLGFGASAVLNLVGLYGGSRSPSNWLSRVAKSKDDVKKKGALHLIHGEDVARAIVWAFELGSEEGKAWKRLEGKRWIVCDLHVYDWWDVMYELGPQAEAERMKAGEGEGLKWREVVLECMEEEGIKALPRNTEGLGRVLDGRELWKRLGIVPVMGREWARM